VTRTVQTEAVLKIFDQLVQTFQFRNLFMQVVARRPPTICVIHSSEEGNGTAWSISESERLLIQLTTVHYAK
jgi:hydroxyacyl-ACP dehydratase HTD2-like protein with hotdog domain